jgi:hypothetical protein
MSSSVVPRLAALCTLLGLLLVSGSARAQFDECIGISLVPNAILSTIFNEASINFGEASEKVCAGVVKDGVKVCKAQVKAAAKCFVRSQDANYSIALKQCQALESPDARVECKAEFKALRSARRSEVEELLGIVFARCSVSFAGTLSDLCLGTL